MTAKQCFDAKIAIGRVSRAAGQRIKAIIADAEQRHAAGDAVGARAAMNEALTIAKHEALRKQAVTAGNIQAQLRLDANIGDYARTVDRLRTEKRAPLQVPFFGMYQGKGSELGLAVQSMFYGDLLDIGNKWSNVFYLASSLRGEAQALFAKGVAYLRPKNAGLTHQHAREADVLSALLHGQASPEARAVAEAFTQAAEKTRVADFNAAAGYEAIPQRARWGLPNPAMEPAKMQAWPLADFIARTKTYLDRDAMIDFDTKLPMSDAKLDAVLASVHETGRTGGAEGGPSAGFVGQGPLSAQRSGARTLVFKDAASWQAFNADFGTGAGPFETMMRHLNEMTHDAAIMRVFGPDPESARRYVLSRFEREANRLSVTGDPQNPKSMADALQANRKLKAQIAKGREKFEANWEQMTGAANISTNAALAETMGTARHLLVAAQLGQAVISSFGDIGAVMSQARFNGLPMGGVLSRVAREFFTKDSEISAAQAGLLLDTLAHGAREADTFVGQTVRGATAAKLSTAVIRGSGLRAWSAKIRDGFAMEYMARMASAIERDTPYAQLPFRESLDRYGITADDWARLSDVTLQEPRPGAKLLSPVAVKAAGHADIGDKLGQLLQQEINRTAIETDPQSRAIALGRTKPGTLAGETMRSLYLYRSMPVTWFNIMLNRSVARGWDGSRMAHAAFTFAAMTIFGVLSMQVKHMLAGRDPLSLDPTTPEGRGGWAAGVLQGGGLGVFGDLVMADKTRLGNSWASIAAGPVGDLAESVLGEFLIRNIENGMKGRPTHFAGDAYWIASRYVPGSNLWFARLAFQRAVTDQLGLMIDERAPERFQRIEDAAHKNFHQDYWWRSAQPGPQRAPDLGVMFGH